MVRAFRDKPALGAWEVINEPEGSILVESNENPCYDTTIIGWANVEDNVNYIRHSTRTIRLTLAIFNRETGAGWTGNQIPMQRFLAFINKQNAAIREEDPKALITAGAWSERSQNSVSSDSCELWKKGSFCPTN